jgi:serine protease AprX
VLSLFGTCLDYDWGPDLEARLVDPNGAELDLSICPVGDECGNGRQETLHAMPTVAGTYSIQVFPTEDAPHNGAGGSFRVDLSTGPVGGAPPPPPPPPPPAPRLHVGDLDASTAPVGSRWQATIVVAVHDATEAPVAGVTVTGTLNGGATGSCVTGTAGTCSITRRFPNKRSSATFSITNLSLSGFTYDAAANHDPDGDSTGTSITVLRP